ncbi:GH10137 [Drosophila grimshawi]|uniref:GH10137 n=2 Tax=Drosophila grimshawi TaxID=7222 RepID=B4JCC5_DROGR|nr:GH10137 [Drosophila grimshawi]
MSDLMEDVQLQQVEQQLELEEHTPQPEEEQQEQEQQEEQQLEVQQEIEEAEEQQLQQLTQDVDTMAHNEEAVTETETETEMPLYDRDSLIENFANDDETNFESSHLVERESLMQREREELESSDDEDANANPIEMSDTFNDEWATLDAADPANDLDNSIDAFESYLPVDISNDIAVNDVAAANPDYPYNPDAEVFELSPSAIAAMSKFEKLSLKTPTPLLK